MSVVTTVFRGSDRTLIVREYGPKLHIGAVILRRPYTVYLHGRYQKQYPMSDVTAWCDRPPIASDLDLIAWFDSLVDRAPTV